MRSADWRVRVHRGARREPHASRATARLSARLRWVAQTQRTRRDTMGIEDKVSGRLKQAAGSLSGKEALRREGKEEERRGDIKREAARERGAAARDGGVDPDTRSRPGAA